MIHYLFLGYLDIEALRGCVALAVRPLDPGVVRRVIAEFPRVKAEILRGCVVLPWRGLGGAAESEAFAVRLQELTGCLIADRRNGRLIDVAELQKGQKAAG